MTAPNRHATPWAWAIVGAVLGAALVLVLHAPAHWLARALAQTSAGHVQLSQTQGRLWDGSARLQLTGGAGSHDRIALPGRVHWQLRPQLKGLQVQIQLQLRADCCTPDAPLQLQLRPRWGGADVRLADGQSQWPAALLTGLGTPFNTIQAQGELVLATQDLSAHWRAGRLQLAGRASLTARDMASRLSSLRPLGSYRFELNGGPTLAVQLSTLEGALQLSGSGQWVGQRLRFQGEASATPEHLDALANLLNLLGQRRGDKALIVFN